jgi:hypothetical protein
MFSYEVRYFDKDAAAKMVPKIYLSRLCTISPVRWHLVEF